MSNYTISIAGDSAINLEFSRIISPETSTMIRMAALNLSEDPIKGIVEIVPTFCSLMVAYNPVEIGYDSLCAALEGKLAGLSVQGTIQKKVTHIPVCYGGTFGPDLENVSKLAGISTDEVISIHSSKDYLIDMLGFLPGFAYLGGLDPRIHVPRLEIPRTSISAGSVGIGGAQTGIYPLDSPGGWQIIGRSPLRPYNPDSETPILYSAGEYLRFEPVSSEEYRAIEAQLAAGKYNVCVTIGEVE